MNWDALGAIGESIGAAAVVVTLIYLAAQIRQSTKLARSTIRESRTRSSQEFLFRSIDAAELMAKLASDTELTIAEQIHWEMLMRAMFRDWEAYAYQNGGGLFEDSEWQAMLNTWRGVLANQAVRDIWVTQKDEYSVLLGNHVGDLIGEVEDAN